MSYYQIEKIRPSVYTIYDPLGVYCYLVVGNKKALLFDVAHGISSLKEVVSEICDLPVEVVLSHGHWDHTEGAGEFQTLWLHPKDEHIFRRCFTKETRSLICDMYQEQIQTFTKGRFQIEAYIEGVAIPAIKHLEEDQVFDLGGVTAQIISMEGHTPGSVGLLLEKEKLLLTGDAANGHCWMFLEDSLEMPVYIAMLRKVFRLDFTTFCMSHAKKEFPKSDFEQYRKVAENITLEKAKPYDYKFKELGGYIYQEGDVAIVFDPKRLRQSV